MAGDDIFSIQLNAFSSFVGDFGLVDRRKKSHCSSTAFDQLFIAVDCSNMGGKVEEKHNRKKALNRREWLQALVQIAVMKYVGATLHTSCNTIHLLPPVPSAH